VHPAAISDHFRTAREFGGIGGDGAFENDFFNDGRDGRDFNAGAGGGFGNTGFNLSDGRFGSRA